MLAFVKDNCYNAVMTFLEGQKVMDRCVSSEQDDGTYTLFNMSSAVNAGFRLSGLVPPVHVEGSLLSFDDEKSFDVIYAQYLVNDDAGFVDMFRVVNNLYLGGSSIILVGDGGYKETLTESFIKFLQQRYGLSFIRIINEPEDWFSYDEVEDFSKLVGIYNLDIDKERYTRLTTDFKELQSIIEGD